MNLITKTKSNKEKYPNASQTKVLFYHFPPEEYWPVPFFSNQMIVIGPDLKKEVSPSESSGDSYIKKRIHVQSGACDLNPLIEQVSEVFEPDVLICWYDTNRNSVLVNLDCFKGLKVMLCGDCHHLYRPVELNLLYAKKENFDFVFNGDLRFSKIFENYNPKKNYWLPGLISKEIFMVPRKNPINEILHIGDSSKFHILRNQYLRSFSKLSLPVNNLRVQHDKVFGVYNKYALTINIDLNGDMNARWYYVPSAGGVLISNKLSDSTGYQKIYSNKEVPTFSSPNEADELLKKYLINTELRYETALILQKKYKETVSRTIVLELFWDLINSKKTDSFFINTMMDYSSIIKAYDSKLEWSNLMAYQAVQECMRISSKVKLIIDSEEEKNINLLRDFKEIEVSLISKKNKKSETKIVKKDLSYDAQILITDNSEISNFSDFDLIIQQNKVNENPIVGYRLLSKHANFSVFKKDTLNEFNKIFNIKAPNSLKYILSHFNYATFLNQKQSNFSKSDRNILIIGESDKAKHYLKSLFNNYNFCSMSSFKEVPFFDNKSEVFDIIILFDDSDCMNSLAEKLDFIYGLMKLSAVFLFFSARFVLGPYGWEKNLPIYGFNYSMNKRPWLHLEEVIKTFEGKPFDPNDFEKKLYSLLQQENSKKHRSIDYNVKSIELEIAKKGYKIINNQLLTIPTQPPFKFNMDGSYVDLNSYGYISLLEKFNWLEEREEIYYENNLLYSGIK